MNIFIKNEIRTCNSMIVFRHALSFPCCMLYEGKTREHLLSVRYQVLGSKPLDRSFVNSLLETVTFFWK